MTMLELLSDGPDNAPTRLALAHGAGAGMDSPFMESVARALAAREVRVVRFEFPYMAQRRIDGRKRPPNQQGVLLDAFREVVARLGGPGGLVLGGKSMGGRMASLLAADYEAAGTPAAGVACLGYPFHPPGRPARTRTRHLEAIRTPVLIVQGTRDPFGTREEAEGYTLSDSVRFHWAPDGDHDLKPRKTSGLSPKETLDAAVDSLARFIREVASPAA